MKEKTKKRLKKLALWTGIAALGTVLVKKNYEQEEEINNLKGELKNVKDMNDGYRKTIERQAFTIGKLHNKLHNK